MKRTKKHHPCLSVIYPNYRRPYPNAAEPQYFLDRLVDGALAVVTSMGTITIVFFLITM